MHATSRHVRVCSTATTYNNLGRVYDETGEYGRAIENFQLALNIRLATVGDSHPATAATYHNIGLAHLQNKQPAQALPFLDKALASRLGCLPAMHVDVTSSYAALASIYRALGEYGKAADYQRRVVAGQQHALGHHSPDLAPAYIDLGDMQVQAHQYSAALEAYRSALHRVVREHDREHVAQLLIERISDTCATQGDPSRLGRILRDIAVRPALVPDMALEDMERA